MMYHEFMQLAGYEVSVEDYDNIIEPMYMTTNLNKADFIKCIDRKRFEVKPQKSPEQLKLEADLKAEIADLKDTIKSYESHIKHLQGLIAVESERCWIESWKDEIKRYRKEIKIFKQRISALKFVLA